MVAPTAPGCSGWGGEGSFAAAGSPGWGGEGPWAGGCARSGGTAEGVAAVTPAVPGCTGGGGQGTSKPPALIVEVRASSAACPGRFFGGGGASASSAKVGTGGGFRVGGCGSGGAGAATSSGLGAARFGCGGKGAASSSTSIGTGRDGGGGTGAPVVSLGTPLELEASAAREAAAPPGVVSSRDRCAFRMASNLPWITSKDSWHVSSILLLTRTKLACSPGVLVSAGGGGRAGVPRTGEERPAPG